MKYRTIGLSDGSVTPWARRERSARRRIVPALDRGLLDGAEFANASSDRLLGLPDVSKICMLQSFHQNAENFEILFNKTKYDALPAKLKAIIANGMEAASADMSWKSVDRYSKDYIGLQTKDKVKFYKTPDSILQEQLVVWDEIVEKKSEGNPLFKESSHRRRRLASGCELGHGYQHQPAYGLQPLFGRQEGRRPAKAEPKKKKWVSGTSEIGHPAACPDGPFLG